MTPSISARIDSMVQAMDDIVLPSIDENNNLAREQAQLVIAHLNLLKKQFAHADAFDRIEMANAVQLGRQLLELTTADAGVAGDRPVLEAAINAGQALPDRQGALRAVNGATEAFIRALRQRGERRSIDAMTRAVLALSQEQSRRNLVWFASNGFDADRDSLPSIESMFA